MPTFCTVVTSLQSSRFNHLKPKRSSPTVDYLIIASSPPKETTLRLLKSLAASFMGRHLPIINNIPCCCFASLSHKIKAV